MEGRYNKMTKTAREYMENVFRAIQANHHNLQQNYEGKSGALKFAREFGYGLNDFPVEQRKDILTSSYGYLCVRLYDLKPPVDAKQWVNAILTQLKEV